MSITVHLTDDITTCLALRRVFFMDEQGVSEADEINDLDAESLHLIAQNDTVPAGTARVTVSGNTAKISRVCVLASHRGTGMGALLIRAPIAQTRENAAVEQIKLGAQTHALAFYEKLGFHAYGPIYDDAGLDHRDMVLTL